MKTAEQKFYDHMTHCVNCHDDLLEALKAGEEWLTMLVSGEGQNPDDDDVILKMRNAIKLVEAQS